MSKSGILVVKYFKNNQLYSSQVFSPATSFVNKQAVGQNTSVTGYWGLNLVFDSKDGWVLKVNGRKRALSFDQKINLEYKFTAVIEKQPVTNIKLGAVEAEKIQKIQVVVLDSKNQYVHSDILPNKRSQKFNFAGTKLKIQRPQSF
jgi:hypothetical protein